MDQLLVEKTKNNISEKREIVETEEISKCPSCRKELNPQKNHAFAQIVYWKCANEDCKENLFIRIKMQNKYFLLKP